MVGPLWQTVSTLALPSVRTVAALRLRVIWRWCILPKGLPAPLAEPTTFLVYIATQRWHQMEAALKGANDAPIVEGVPVCDERLPGLALLAQSATTRTIQQAKREVVSSCLAS